MSIKMFGRKKEAAEEDFRIKDLKSEHKRRRKEPNLPWGKKERLFILFTLLGTTFISLFLIFSSRGFKFPQLPKFNFENFFKGETIIVGNKEDVSKALRAKMAEKVIGDFNGMTQDLSGTYAFEVIDPSTGFKFGLRENEVMQAASLIKLPLMLYSQGKVDDSKIEAMGKRSDNNVFRELVNKFGKNVVQDYIYSLGMKNTSIERNETTSNEIGELLLKIYKDGNEKILNFLTDTIFEKWIKAGVPEGIKVAHKYGREVKVVNDAGIIYSKNPFILVIMTKEVNEEEADRIIPELTKMIYSNYIKIN